MKHYIIQRTDINGNANHIPYVGVLDREELEYIHRRWSEFLPDDNGEVLYEIKESIGGGNYFRIENGVHVPL